MPSVRVEPLGVEIEVAEGESVMGAAQRQGYRWPTICGGQAECTACWVVVEEGEEHCPAPDAHEREKIAVIPARTLYEPKPARLACQLRPTGDLVVFKRGVKQEDG